MNIHLNGISVSDDIFSWVVFLIVALGFGYGYYARYRQKSTNPEVNGFANDRSEAWVGSQGQGLSLNIKQKGDAIRVRWALLNYIIVIVVTFFFGPVVTMMFIFYPEKIENSVPLTLPVWIMAGCFMLIVYSVLINELRKLLFEEPMFDVTIDGVVLLKGHAEIKRIRVRDIKSLTIEKSTFLGSPPRRRQNQSVEYKVPIDNYTLLIHSENGSTTRLCITDNQKQIEQLKSQMETKLRLTTDSAIPLSA